MAEVTIPYGKAKGTPLSQADKRDLEWCLDAARKSVDNPEKARWKPQNERLVKAISDELSRRASGGKQEVPEPKPSTALATRPAAEPSLVVEGAFIDPGAATAALREAARRYFLVSPSPACATLRDGYEMTISVVHVDPMTETYCQTGNHKNPKPDDKVSLGKVALERICSAVGATWLYEPDKKCQRLDDGSDPAYCEYIAWLRYQAFDGFNRDVCGHVAIDMRPGSAQVEEIRQAAAERKRRFPDDPNDGGDKQILMTKKFILRIAASKAMLVAIRRLGFPATVTRRELEEKGFACARAMFTGRSTDPVAAAQYRAMIAQSELFGKAALYGGQAPALPAPAHPPPPVGRALHAFPDVFDVGMDEEPEPEPQPARTQPQPHPAQPHATVEPKPAQAPAAPAAPSQPQQAPAEPAKPEKLVGLPPDQDRGDDPNAY